MYNEYVCMRDLRSVLNIIHACEQEEVYENIPVDFFEKKNVSLHWDMVLFFNCMVYFTYYFKSSLTNITKAQL